MTTQIRRKRTPSHPGGILQRVYMKPLGLKVTDLAAKLSVSRKTVSKIVNERGAIEPYMALRLSRVFNTNPALWMNMQHNHDLAIASKTDTTWERIEPLDACLAS
jgi:antitoxin HigA-1